MGTPKDLAVPFTNAGLVLKQDQTLLSPGQYSQLTNMTSSVEGVLTVRNGAQLLAFFSLENGQIHNIARLIITGAGVIRYLGQGSSILRSNSPLGIGMTFTSVATNVSTSSNIAQQRWDDADFGLGTSSPYKFFACPNAMLKDDDAFNPLQQWGIFPPTFPAMASTTGSGVGPPAFSGAEVPYTYAYTFYNSSTQSESNPPAFMLPTLGISPNGHVIDVVLHGTSDPQIPTAGASIKVYRAGGSFADGLYRFLGYATNPGNPGATTTFQDVFLDQDILDNDTMDTDNDPPVPASLPNGFVGVVASYVTGPGTAGSLNQMQLSSFGGTPGFFPSAGDTIILEAFTANAETAIVESSNPGLSRITVWFQASHTSLPIDVTVSTHTGSPATIVLSAFNSMFLAGDPYNPQVLYKSKTGLPESFGVLQTATGISDAINVGTPSNPILGLVEYSNAVICLNLENIFSVGVYGGVMQQPITTPARHGLLVRKAYVKVANEIWYISYDGIYAFSGGEEKWMSEAIDPLFNGLTINGYLPIDLRPGLSTVGSDVITFATVKNDVVMNYTDTSGKAMRLRYELKFSRWHVESFYENQDYTEIYSLYTEADSGNSFMGMQVGTGGSSVVLNLTDTGTTDGWTTNPAGASPIAYLAAPTTVDAAPPIDKFFADIQLECSNTDTVDIATFYNFGAADGIDIFTIAPGTRQRYPFPLQATQGKVAYAIRLAFSGLATGPTSLYSLALHYEDLAAYKQGTVFDYSDLGYPNDKVLRWLNIEMDTGGVTAQIYVDVDGVESGPFPITTTYQDRNRIIAMPSDLIGRMVRLRLVPGTNGKTNWFSNSWSVSKEPASLTFWDSDELTFGWNGYNFVKQLWLELICSSPVVFTMYVDNDQLFYTLTIPAQAHRNVFRAYLPAAVGAALNKSKTKRFTLSSNSAFRFYGQGSKFEWLPCGSDQRQGYEQFLLNELTGPEEGSGT